MEDLTAALAEFEGRYEEAAAWPPWQAYWPIM
jgi:hypothetical protein